MKEGILLVGLGDKTLADLVRNVKGDEKNMGEVLELIVNSVPRYKTFTSCDEEEKDAFVEFMDIMKQYVGDEDDG